MLLPKNVAGILGADRDIERDDIALCRFTRDRVLRTAAGGYHTGM